MLVSLTLNGLYRSAANSTMITKNVSLTYFEWPPHFVTIVENVSLTLYNIFFNKYMHLVTKQLITSILLSCPFHPCLNTPFLPLSPLPQYSFPAPFTPASILLSCPFHPCINTPFLPLSPLHQYSFPAPFTPASILPNLFECF
jgi:hypothetical protein